ncbi:MAG: hypothetical protein U0235_13005 [Polyangiaceae bacterium]
MATTFTDTMRGSGWLREAPGNVFPAEWMKLRGRTALRQCIFLPPPGPLPSAPEHVAPAPVRARVEPPPAPASPRVVSPERRSPRRPDPLRRVGLWPAYKTPVAVREHRDAGIVEAHAPDEWSQRPVALGVLLVCFPPAGLAAVWSSTRYDRDAKLALTVSTILFMSLVALVTMVLAR